MDKNHSKRSANRSISLQLQLQAREKVPYEEKANHQKGACKKWMLWMLLILLHPAAASLQA